MKKHISQKGSYHIIGFYNKTGQGRCCKTKCIYYGNYGICKKYDSWNGGKVCERICNLYEE